MDSIAAALAIRRRALRSCHQSRSSHIGSGLSIADLLAVLYGGFLRVSPDSLVDPDRDRFILSKGHAAATYYATLVEFGFLGAEHLERYCCDGGLLGGHVHHDVPGVEVSTGSLGHGLPMGTGMALGGARAGRTCRYVVLMSDGELNSGANWEAVQFAAGHGLDNLLAIIDRNGLQAMGETESIIPLEPLHDRFASFGWGVRRIPGHDHSLIQRTLGEVPFEAGRPSVLIADTVKGKGVSFMENRLEWHYRSPGDEDLSRALAELGGADA